MRVSPHQNLIGPNQIIAIGIPLSDRYSPRRRRRQDRNTFHQNILCMFICKYEHLDVRVSCACKPGPTPWPVDSPQERLVP